MHFNAFAYGISICHTFATIDRTFWMNENTINLLFHHANAKNTLSHFVARNCFCIECGVLILEYPSSLLCHGCSIWVTILAWFSSLPKIAQYTSMRANRAENITEFCPNTDESTYRNSCRATCCADCERIRACNANANDSINYIFWCQIMYTYQGFGMVWTLTCECSGWCSCKNSAPSAGRHLIS